MANKTYFGITVDNYMEMTTWIENKFDVEVIDVHEGKIEGSEEKLVRDFYTDCDKQYRIEYIEQGSQETMTSCERILK